jgi:hypothetical protein
MNLDAILEVGIGLVLSWLVLSVAAMQSQEWISSTFAWRANFMKKAIRNMLGNDQMVTEFYNHPLILSLSKPGKKPGQYRPPSYIPADKFSTAVMDVFFNAGKDSSELPPGTMTIAQMQTTLDATKRANPQLGQILNHIFPRLDSANANMDQVLAKTRLNLESWFNDAMDRLTGWYKRYTAVWSFILGLLIALLFNVDTVQISTQLWKAPTVRQLLVAQASQTQSATANLNSPIQVQDYFNSLAIPVGWSTALAADPSKCGWTPGQNVQPAFFIHNQCNLLVNLPSMDDAWGWIGKGLGILISGAAAAQGSPFWFDILKKLVNIRGSGSLPAVAAPMPAPIPVIPVAVPAPTDSTQSPPQPVG